MPKICQTAKANFSLPNAFEKCQIWVIWHFKMPVGNPVVVVLCDTRDISIGLLIVDTYVTIPVSPRSRYTAVYRSSKKIPWDSASIASIDDTIRLVPLGNEQPATQFENTFFAFFWKSKKRDFLRYFEVSCQKNVKKRIKRCPSFHFSPFWNC